MAQVLRRFGLADGVKIDQAACLAFEDQLGIGKIAMTKAERHGRVGSGEFNRLVEPGFDLRAQIGKDLVRSEEHTSELQSRRDLVCRLLLEKKKKTKQLLYTVNY